jgi:very-short-patch-repair endonuclease
MENPRELARRILSARFLSLIELAGLGIGRHRASALVRAGDLLRLRNGQYAPPDLPAELVRCGRLGGRLDCVSLLAAIGVFVRSGHGIHVQFSPGTTRLPPRQRDVVAHWRPFRGGRGRLSADVVEALVQACRCQAPRDAIATLDSAWHLGVVDEADIAAVFHRLPQRYHVLRRLLDPRCESGSESIMRLILRMLGAHIDVQVRIAGVGRVDFVVDGWLIIECDSRAHHEGWSAQRKDRRRDLAAAALGYTTVRPLAEDILFRPDETAAEIARILSHGSSHRRRPARQNSTDLAGAHRRRG